MPHCLRGVLLALIYMSAAALQAPAADPAPIPGIRASSVHPGDYLPQYAIDGNPKTRWASDMFSPKGEWIEIDFGVSVPITALTIRWETAHAVEYQVQCSNDRKNWQTLTHKKDGKGGTDVLTGLSGAGRYLRLLFLKPNSYNLVSIWEVEFPKGPAAEAIARARSQADEFRRQADLQAQKRLAEGAANIGVDQIVFAARNMGGDGHWYANFGYYARNINRKAYGSPGGKLLRLNLKTGQLTALVDDPQGAIRDPQVHYDGQRIIFSWRKGGSDNYNLYEINGDGTGLRQLTDGPWDDIEPAYLPDGGIVFVSSRCKRWVNCWLTQVAILHRCDADGKNIRPVSSNNEQDNTPWVLPDGRVLYQRWEYVDRSQVDYHHLWTMNPDGTGQMVFFGNMYPSTVMIDAKPIPNTDGVLATFSPGHGEREHEGPFYVIDVKGGPDDRGRARRVGRVDGRDPYPISDHWILYAAGKSIRLMDYSGASFDLYTDAKLPLHEPRPLAPGLREAIIPPRSNSHQATGRLVLADVHVGRNMDGVKPGEIKKLLVLESLPKPINYTGGMDPLTYGGSFTLERVLGTVPVEPDGSAWIELPALRSFFFVALDENNLAVKRMQSFLTVQPGETTGCVGCHEQRTRTILPARELMAPAPGAQQGRARRGRSRGPRLPARHPADPGQALREMPRLRFAAANRKSPISNLRSQISDVRVQISDFRSQISNFKSGHPHRRSRADVLAQLLPAHGAAPVLRWPG